MTSGVPDITTIVIACATGVAIWTLASSGKSALWTITAGVVGAAAIEAAKLIAGG